MAVGRGLYYCTTYLMVLHTILSEKIIPQANKPRRYRRQKVRW